MTTPSCRIDAIADLHVSRIDACAWMSQSAPIDAPAPTTTCGWSIVRAPMRAPAPIDDERPDDVRRRSRRRIDRRQRADARRRPRARHQQRDRLGKRQIQLGRAEHGARRARRRVVGDDGRGACRRQLRGVLGVGQERQVAGSGLFDAGDARHLEAAIALETAAEAPASSARVTAAGVYHPRLRVRTARAATRSTNAARCSRPSAARCDRAGAPLGARQLERRAHAGQVGRRRRLPRDR